MLCFVTPHQVVDSQKKVHDKTIYEHMTIDGAMERQMFFIPAQKIPGEYSSHLDRRFIIGETIEKEIGNQLDFNDYTGIDRNDKFALAETGHVEKINLSDISTRDGQIDCNAIKPYWDKMLKGSGFLDFVEHLLKTKQIDSKQLSMCFLNLPKTLSVKPLLKPDVNIAFYNREYYFDDECELNKTFFVITPSIVTSVPGFSNFISIYREQTQQDIFNHRVFSTTVCQIPLFIIININK